MQSLQPDVAEGDHGVWIVTRRRPLKYTLKLLLTRSPLLLGQVQVANQRPRIGVILYHINKPATHRQTDR